MIHQSVRHCIIHNSLHPMNMHTNKREIAIIEPNNSLPYTKVPSKALFSSTLCTHFQFQLNPFLFSHLPAQNNNTSIIFFFKKLKYHFRPCTSIPLSGSRCVSGFYRRNLYQKPAYFHVQENPLDKTRDLLTQTRVRGNSIIYSYF